MSAADFEGAEGVGGELRDPDLFLGNHRVTVLSIREHKSVKGSGNRLLVKFLQKGEQRTGSINLGGKHPQYGVRDTKALIAAIRGVAGSDPAIAAMGYEQMKGYWSDIEGTGRLGWGTEIEITAFESDKINAKTGKPYVNFRPYKLGSLSGLGEVTTARTPVATAAPEAVAPVAVAPPPPPAPVAPPAPEAPWFPMSPDTRGNQYRIGADGSYEFRSV